MDGKKLFNEHNLNAQCLALTKQDQPKHVLYSAGTAELSELD